MYRMINKMGGVDSVGFIVFFLGGGHKTAKFTLKNY